MPPPGRAGRPGLNRLALGGLVGPTVFVADWAILGALRPGYSPVDDAISRLAELGASSRPAMTRGFIVYGAGLIGYGLALRRAVRGPAGHLAVATGVTTLGVAAFPLGTPTSDAIHGVLAALGYATLAAVPLAATPDLVANGHLVAARLSLLSGTVTAALLLASAAGAPAHGLTQRIGLSVGDAWVLLSAAQLLRRR